MSEGGRRRHLKAKPNIEEQADRRIRCYVDMPVMTQGLSKTHSVCGTSNWSFIQCKNFWAKTINWMSIVVVVFAWWGLCKICLWKKTVAIIEGHWFSEMQWQSSRWWEQQEGWQQQQQLCLPQGNSRQLFQPALLFLLAAREGGEWNNFCKDEHFFHPPVPPDFES